MSSDFDRAGAKPERLSQPLVGVAQHGAGVRKLCDVDAWVIGMLGAPLALLVGSVGTYVASAGVGGVLAVLWWQLVSSILVLMASIVLSPIAFIAAERSGIANLSKAKLWMASGLVAPIFVAVFLHAGSSGFAQAAAIVTGVCLNVALFGAVYTRGNA